MADKNYLSWLDDAKGIEVQSDGTKLDVTSKLNLGDGLIASADLANERINISVDASFLTSSGGAPTNASYVTLGTHAGLTAERSLVVGSGLRSIDAGPNGNLSLSINDNVVATVSGTRFTGPVEATGGLTGSLQKTSAGLSFMVAGDNITIVSGSNGQVTISSTASGSGGGGAVDSVFGRDGDVEAEYGDYTAYQVLYEVPETFNNVGQALDSAFNELGNLFNDKAPLNFIAEHTAPVTAPSFSGSLTQLQDGKSYLVAGDNITIVSQSNGQVRISAAGGGGGGGSGADFTAQYVTMASTSSLPNERVLTAGTGLTRTDGGAGSNVTLAINDSVVATVSGSTFAQLTGSLQKTPAGLSYLVAGANVSIFSASNGQITISSTGGGGGGGGDITSVFGRTGIVTAMSGDYDASQITFDPEYGDTVADAIDNILCELVEVWVTGSRVMDVYGRTGSIGSEYGDYDASQIVYVIPESGNTVEYALNTLFGSIETITETKTATRTISLDGWCWGETEDCWAIDGQYYPTEVSLAMSGSGSANRWIIDITDQFPPNAQYLQGVTVYVRGASGHSGLPAQMPFFTLKRITTNGTENDEIAGQTDASANTTAYQAAHSITWTGDTAIFLNNRYLLTVYGEKGTNALTGLRLISVVLTYTYVI